MQSLWCVSAFMLLKGIATDLQAFLLQAANASFKSQRSGQGNGKSGGVGNRSFKHSPSKTHPSAHTSQEGGTSVMSKMKRSMTILAGRAVSESGMTERSTRVGRCVVASHPCICADASMSQDL